MDSVFGLMGGTVLVRICTWNCACVSRSFTEIKNNTLDRSYRIGDDESEHVESTVYSVLYISRVFLAINEPNHARLIHITSQ